MIPNDTTSWTQPPSGWNYGSWYLSQSSNAEYQEIRNFQVDVYPILPVTNFRLVNNSDLSSYNLPGNSTQIITVYGVDIPLPEFGPFVFNYTDSGAISESGIFAWISWGLDTEGVEFYITYNAATIGTTNTPAEIDFQSRRPGGPTNVTKDAILRCVVALGNDVLTPLAQQVQPTPLDGRRIGQGPPGCDAACLNNTDLVA